MKNFSSIKELLSMLSREQKLITEIFEKRKVLSYKYDDALEVLDYNEDKLHALIEFAVLKENGSFLELDDLEHLDIKRNDISSLVALTDKLVSGEEEQTFFKTASDEELKRVIVGLKSQLNSCRHNLIDIQKQIIEFLNRLKYQSGLLEKIRQLKYLKDQFELRSKTNIVQVLSSDHSLVYEPKPAYSLKLSIEQLQSDDEALEVIKKVLSRIKSGIRTKQPVSDNNLEDYLRADTEEIAQINLEEVKNSFLAGSNNLFDFLQTYDFGNQISFEECITVYCQLISQYDMHFRLTDQYQIKQDTEYLLIYPL